MLTNMASDLDQLLTGLGPSNALTSDDGGQTAGRRPEGGSEIGTPDSSTLRSRAEAAGRRQFEAAGGGHQPLATDGLTSLSRPRGRNAEVGTPTPSVLYSSPHRGNGAVSQGFLSPGAGWTTTGSSPSVLSSSSDNNPSADSGTGDRRQPTTSPVSFHPSSLPYGLQQTRNTPTKGLLTSSPAHGQAGHGDNGSSESGERRPISLVERLATTHSIWLLAEMSRAGAIHLLKDRDTGVFLIRKSSQSKSLALSVQNRQRERTNVDHYLIELCEQGGMRLQGSGHVFRSLPVLLAHYMEHLDELPYRLTLPDAILHAKSSRELSSLAMLGQDFWLSLISHHAGFTPGSHGSVHTAASEPASQREPFQTTDYTDVHSASALSTLSSQPSARPPNNLSGQDDPQAFRQQLGVQMAASHQHTYQSRPTFTSPVPEAVSESHVPLGPPVLRLTCPKDAPTSTDYGGEEGDELVRPHLQLLGTSPGSCAFFDMVCPSEMASLKVHQTHVKPNLYSTAPLEFLDLPDDSYFCSNLSDKMSDYEDVWRSSCYDSDSVRNGSVRGIGNHDAASAVTTRSEFTKFFALSGSRTGSIANAAVTQMRASVDSKSHSTTNAAMILNIKPERHTSRTNLGHFGRMNRLKSSSDSSLATVPSPIYAEPVDAIVFREKRSRIPRRRRLSAPSVSTDMDSPTHSRHLDRKFPLEFPRYPTVYWTDAKHLPESTRSSKFTFEPQKDGSAGSDHFNNNWRSRSQSVTREEDNLSRKHSGWQERFSRLKLGTKVLGQDGSPYARNAVSVPPGSKYSRCAFDENPGPRGTMSSSQLLHKSPESRVNRTAGAVVRESYLSECSTVQDLISRAMPEVMVAPVQPQQQPDHLAKPLSEYDNFNPREPPSPSSPGTIFCKPWEAGAVNSLIRRSQVYLPPAMDLQERVQKWQEANQTFHERSAGEGYSRHEQEEACRNSLGNEQNQSQSAMTVALRDGASQLDVNTDSRKASHMTSASFTQHQHIGRSLHKPLARPQSFYHHSQAQTQPRHVNVKLSRSLSQPSQPFQTACRNSQHQQVFQQPQRQQQAGRRDWQVGTGVHQGVQGFTEHLISGAGDQKEVLSSHCPDVINCHHIAMSTLSTHRTMVSTQRGTTGQRVPYHSHGSYSPGRKIKEYIHKLSQDHSTIFGGSIDYFIRCTMDSQDRNPHHVMRNVRQFMTGIKNYLVKHGEGQLENLIETERAKLGTNEILNIDGLIETTLHVCVLKPLKHHIYRLLVDFHHRNHSLEMMSSNIIYARTKSPQELGIKAGVTPPNPFALDVTIKGYLLDMQRAFSPLVKLEHLLKVTSAICSNVKVHGNQVPLKGPGSLGADDFLPLLIHTLVHCGVAWAELEADYMWGLLHPSVLSGEGGYCLTTLSSAILLLKNFKQAHDTNTISSQAHLPSSGEVQGFLKIAFPDELRDTIVWKTLPVRPNMTTKDVCAMIAHKFKFTNPQDYGLILLCEGEERQLDDSQCAQILKRDHLAAGKDFFFAYKRLDANIAWPSSVQHL